MSANPSQRVNLPFVHVLARAALHPLLLRASDYRALVAVLRRGLDRHPARLLAYAVLPRHWELVLGPCDSARARLLAQWVSATHTDRLRNLGRLPPGRHSYRGPATVRRLESAGDLVRTCRAVERRALDERLVWRAQDWPWSSLTDRFRLLQHLPLASVPFLASDGWIAYTNHPQPLPGRLRPSGHFTEHPSPLTPLLQRGQQLAGVLLVGHEDQPHTHVERPKHLRLRHLTGRL